jgi:hypothetical protein
MEIPLLVRRTFFVKRRREEWMGEMKRPTVTVENA